MSAQNFEQPDEKLLEEEQLENAASEGMMPPGRDVEVGDEDVKLGGADIKRTDAHRPGADVEQDVTEVPDAAPGAEG